MHVSSSINSRLYNHCRCGTAMSITQPVCVCVFVALVIQHAMRMRHIVVCGLLRSTKVFFSHYLIKGTIFENVTEHKMCVQSFSTTFV